MHATSLDVKLDEEFLQRSDNRNVVVELLLMVL